MDGLGDLVERFDHVGYGVRDIGDTLPFVALLGGMFLQGADHLRNRFRWVQFRLPGGARLELIQPLAPDSFLTRFLAARGEGIHHLTFKVRDVPEAADRAGTLGFRTTGLHLHPDWSEVFLHPKSAHGALIQLAAWDDEAAAWGNSLEKVMAGTVHDLT